MNALLSEADRLAGLGVCTVPIRNRGDKKRPAGPWRDFRHPPDATGRARMFEQPSLTGLAIVNGEPSAGLACRDFDIAGRFEAWAEREPSLAAELPIVRTPRGAHVYFTAAGLDGVRKMPDGELRLARCFTLIPPSLHPTGARYEWVRRLDALPRLLDPVEAGLGPCDIANTANKANTSHKGGEGDDNGATAAQRCAASSVPEGELRAMVLRTLPQREGERNNRLWDFAREVRVYLPKDAEVAKLKPIARVWFDAALPIIGTREWLESWVDFKRAFERVEVPADEHALRLAIERAKSADAPAALAAEFGDSEGLLRLACVCRELARLSGGRFYLSARAAGDAVGVDRMTAWRWLGLLCDEGVLELLKPGTRGERGKATVYAWRGDGEAV